MNNWHPSSNISGFLYRAADRIVARFYLDTLHKKKNLIHLLKTSYVFMDVVRVEASANFRYINGKQFRFKKWRLVVTEKDVKT